MNTKWYISTLIIILALIGLNQGQTQVANQKIVLQFTDVEITSRSAHDSALATITKKLQALGIANIEIIEEGDKRLSIRYYSDIDALSVGKFLSQDGELVLSSNHSDQFPLEFPNDELPETCSLVVFDLHQQTDAGLSLNGRFAVQSNQSFKRFFTPVVLQLSNAIVFQQNTSADVAYKINRVVTIAIDNTSQTIPEVRAGPHVYGNS
jgi:hypothetical protein